MNIDDLHDDDIDEVEPDSPELDDDDFTDDETKQTDDAPVDDELGFSFDEPEKSDESDPYAGKPAPEWVKKVREENRELKRQLKQVQTQQPKQQPLRDKPTLAAYDYDETAYETDLQNWYAEKAKHDEVIKQEQDKYQKIDDNYKQSVDKVRSQAKDYDDIEQMVVDTLQPEQQALLKMGASDPAKLVYILGKSPNKLAELSQLDAVNFVKQIGIMEYQMTNKSRNPNKPQPKTHELTGSAGGGDTKLAKLEAEAAKTGDRSKILSYKKSLKK